MKIYVENGIYVQNETYVYVCGAVYGTGTSTTQIDIIYLLVSLREKILFSRNYKILILSSFPSYIHTLGLVWLLCYATVLFHSASATQCSYKYVYM